MAKLSLQEQLLKSGLVSTGQARAVKSEKQKQAKQQHQNKSTAVDVTKEQVQKARLEQAEKDRQLNLQRKLEEERKQITAQVKQLIEQNRLPQDKVITDDSFAYHFIDDNKVKTLYVSKSIRDQISRGQLVIVRSGQKYEVIPVEIAEKIQGRDGTTNMIINNQTASSDAQQQDPYAAYQVPDDLMW